MLKKRSLLDNTALKKNVDSTQLYSTTMHRLGQIAKKIRQSVKMFFNIDLKIVVRFTLLSSEAASRSCGQMSYR